MEREMDWSLIFHGTSLLLKRKSINSLVDVLSTVSVTTLSSVPHHSEKGSH